jgi:multidrug resistance efflux pump
MSWNRGIVLFIAFLIMIAFFSHHAKDKERESEMVEDSPSLRLPTPNPREESRPAMQPREGKAVAAPVNVNSVAITSPVEGMISMRVKTGDKVAAGEVIADVANMEISGSAEGKEKYEGEWNDLVQAKKIAEDDAASLTEEIVSVRERIQKAKDAVSNARRDRERGLVSDREVHEADEEYRTAMLHLENTESMLQTKHRAMDAYQTRMKALQGLLGAIKRGASLATVAVRATCDGTVAALYAISGMFIDKNTPILILTPGGALSVASPGPVREQRTMKIPDAGAVRHGSSKH